jgi:hypothetical protein
VRGRVDDREQEQRQRRSAGLVARADASCGVEACSAALAAASAASADFLTAAVTRPSPMCSCRRMSTCVKFGGDALTVHQSMNGLP